MYCSTLIVILLSMFKKADYIQRGANFVRNKVFSSNKKLSTLMIYATDLCDSACKHCLIWAKRPVVHIPKEKIYELVTQNKCVTKNTRVGLEGGEFLLHPDALEIMEWFHNNHPKFDLFTNCLKPDKAIAAVNQFPPEKLYVSLDGTKSTYKHMRGKDGYDSVIKVIDGCRNKVPVCVLFTLSPYNDFEDLKHVADICVEYGVDLRVGIYNNVNFFDTLDKAHETNIGDEKNDTALKFGDLKYLKEVSEATKEMKALEKNDIEHAKYNSNKVYDVMARSVPKIVSDFKENYDYLVLYDEWRNKKLRLKCFSILDSVVVFPNGDVPICQYLDMKIGNVHTESLDSIFNKEETQKKQDLYVHNCNQCWLAFHRKYDVALYKNFEKIFGSWATSKTLGYYQWTDDAEKTYKTYFEELQERINEQ